MKTAASINVAEFSVPLKPPHRSTRRSHTPTWCPTINEFSAGTK